MAEKILTGAEMQALFQECVPNETIDWTRFNKAYFNNKLNANNQCVYKIDSIPDSGMSTFWQYITNNSSLGYAGPSGMPSSAWTSSIASNKLYSKNNLTPNPATMFYGCKVGGNNSILLSVTGNSTATYKGKVSIMLQTNTAAEIWNSGVHASISNNYNSSCNPSNNKNNVMTTGSTLLVRFDTTGLTSLGNMTAYLYDNQGQQITQASTTSTSTDYLVAAGSQLSLAEIKKLANLSKVGLFLNVSNGSTPSTPSYYVFQVNAPTTLEGTTIPLTPLWNATGTDLYNTLQFDLMAVCIYDQNFQTVKWMDNYNASSYSNGVLKIPWDTIHPILSGITSPSLYLRVPMKYSPYNNTVVYPVVLYFQLIPTASSEENGQAYGITSNSKVYLDISNVSQESVPNGAMKINVSGANYPPFRYLPNAYTNENQSNGSTLGITQGASTFNRSMVPNPHIQYFQNNGSTTLYFNVNSYNVTQLGVKTKINLLPSGTSNLASWVSNLYSDEGIIYNIKNTPY